MLIFVILTNFILIGMKAVLTKYKRQVAYTPNMNNLDVLAIGYLVRDDSGKILQAHSTSTLIRTPDRLIVVDTSSREFRPALRIAFKQIGVFAKDVDTVVLTHHHNDHTGNVDMFPNAKVLIHSGEDRPFRGAEVVEGDMSLAKGIELRHTPGHSWDSMSVFVEGPDRKYVIAGDAIPLEDNYRKNVPPALHVCKDLAMKSIKTISDYADVIIPGHGGPFKIKG